MYISPQLRALLVLKNHNYIAEMGFPRYIGCHGGTHNFKFKNGNEVRVDLVLNKAET